MTFSFVIFVFVFVFDFVLFCFLFVCLFVFSFLFKMYTVGLYVSLCLMIFLCPFVHCKELRTVMYKRYINSIIIIIIIIKFSCKKTLVDMASPFNGQFFLAHW